MDRKVKIIGLVLGIVLFVVAIAGLTYASITWTSGNINNVVNSKCFNVLYTKGTDISGAIMPSSDYTGGTSSTFKFNISSSCDINANGKLYLITDSSTSSNLYREGLLNYQVVSGSTLIKSGGITSSGEIEIDLGELTKASSASTSYTIYVWIDNDLVENSDAFSSYSGSIRLSAVQFK